MQTLLKDVWETTFRLVILFNSKGATQIKWSEGQALGLCISMVPLQVSVFCTVEQAGAAWSSSDNVWTKSTTLYIITFTISESLRQFVDLFGPILPSLESGFKAAAQQLSRGFGGDDVASGVQTPQRPFQNGLC